MERGTHWEQLTRSWFSSRLYAGVLLALVFLIRLSSSINASESVAPWLLVLSPLWLALVPGIPSLARLVNSRNLGLIRIGHVLPLLFVLLLDVGFFVAARLSPQAG